MSDEPPQERERYRNAGMSDGPPQRPRKASATGMTMRLILFRNFEFKFQDSTVNL